MRQQNPKARRGRRRYVPTHTWQPSALVRWLGLARLRTVSLYPETPEAAASVPRSAWVRPMDIWEPTVTYRVLRRVAWAVGFR